MKGEQSWFKGVYELIAGEKEVGEKRMKYYDRKWSDKSYYIFIIFFLYAFYIFL